MYGARSGIIDGVRFALAFVLAVTLLACGSFPTATYTDPRDQWTITYPVDTFTVTPFDTSSNATDTGIWVANYHEAFDGSYRALDTIPEDGIALRIWRAEVGTLAQPASDDSSFPISLDDFVPDASFGMFEDPVVATYEFQGNGVRYRAGVWISSGATDEDRNAVADVVSSLRFP